MWELNDAEMPMNKRFEAIWVVCAETNRIVTLCDTDITFEKGIKTL